MSQDIPSGIALYEVREISERDNGRRALTANAVQDAKTWEKKSWRRSLDMKYARKVQANTIARSFQPFAKILHLSSTWPSSI